MPLAESDTHDYARQTEVESAAPLLLALPVSVGLLAVLVWLLALQERVYWVVNNLQEHRQGINSEFHQIHSHYANTWQNNSLNAIILSLFTWISKGEKTFCRFGSNYCAFISTGSILWTAFWIQPCSWLQPSAKSDAAIQQLPRSTATTTAKLSNAAANQPEHPVQTATAVQQRVR